MRKRANRATDIQVVVLLSDLHCGSSLAIMPPEFTDSEDRTHRQNPVQKIIWGVWREFVDTFIPSVVGDDAFALVVNGDAIEGVHHGGAQCITQDPAEHSAMAYECLREVAEKANCRRVFLTEGTECHTRGSENRLGSMLGAVPPAGSKGRYCHKELMLRVNGCAAGFWHHMPTSQREYLSASQLSIQWGNSWISRTANGFEGAKVVCAAHRHVFGQWTDGKGMMVVTPSWQARTRFGHKVVPGVVEGFGGVVLDWRGRPSGSLPRVHSHVVPLAPPETIEV